MRLTDRIIKRDFLSGFSERISRQRLILSSIAREPKLIKNRKLRESHSHRSLSDLFFARILLCIIHRLLFALPQGGRMRIKMEKIRLSKFFSDCGIMSRRAAEEEIKKGNITVNGHIAELGEKVDAESDEVIFN